MQPSLSPTTEPKNSLFQKNFNQLLLAALGAGLLLPLFGILGRVVALLIFGTPLLYILYLRLQHRQRSYNYFFILGFFTTGEIFFRDFALIIIPFGGYLFVLYTIIALALFDLDALIALTRNRKFTGVYTALVLFVLWTAFSIVYSSDPYKGRWFTSLYAAAAAMTGLALAYGMSKVTRQGLIQGGLVGVMLMTGVTVGVLFSSGGRNSLGEVRLGTGWVSAVQIATVLSIGALVFIIYFYESRRFNLIALGCFALTSLLLFFTYSRGPLLALMIAVSIYIVLRGSFRRGFILTILLLIVGTFVFNLYLNRPIDTRPVTAANSNSESLFQKRFVDLNEVTNRLPIWDAAIHIWLANPIAGVGVGGWFTAYEDYTGTIYGDSSEISDAHSVIFQAAAEGGLIAVIPLVIALIAFIVAALKHRSATGLAFISWAISIGVVANWKLAAIAFALGAAAISIWLEECEGKDTFITRAMMAQRSSQRIKDARESQRATTFNSTER